MYRFTGPKITLSLDDLSESQERALAEDGLDVEDTKPLDPSTQNPPVAEEAHAAV